MMAKIDHVYTAKSISGDAWMRFILSDGSECWFALDWLPTSPAALSAALARQGIITSKQQAARYLELIANAEPDTGPPPIDRPGWNGLFFLFADGTAIAPRDQQAGPMVVKRAIGAPRKAGTHKKWMQMVAERLAGHAPLQFAVLQAVMPVVASMASRPIGTIVELIIPDPAQRRLAIMVGQSVTGRLTEGSLGSGIALRDAFGKAAASGLARHVGLVAPIDEVELAFAATTPRQSIDLIKKLLERSAGGNQPFGRCLYSQRSLIDIAGLEPDLVSVAEERVITLKIDDALGPLGDEHDTRFDYYQKLEEAITSQHGKFIDRFVHRLVQAKATDEPHLLARIERLNAAFRTRVGADKSDAPVQPIADYLGLIYATGRLAQAWKLLPASWKLERIVVRMWHSHARHPTPRLSLDEEIEAAAASPAVVHTGFGVVAPDEETLAAAPIIWHHRKNGRDELRLRPRTAGQHIPRLGAKRVSAETKARLVMDGDHLTTKRDIVKGKPDERVICIPLVAA